METEDLLLYLTFNQDASCFAAGTQKGFKIFNSHPLKDNFERILESGIGIIELLYRCNIIALVGGGRNPKYSPDKVIIWDDHQTKVISELRFSSKVKNVKLKKDKIIVILETKIYVFNFISFQKIDTIESFDNPKGLIAVSSDQKSSVIAYPDKSRGYVRVKSYDNSSTSLINAHNSDISCIALNSDGTFLATSSEKGTLVRIFKAEDGTFLQELRRGKERAEILSISFDAQSKFIACSSNKGTIHIWSLSTANKKIKDNEILSNETSNTGEKNDKDESYTIGDNPKFDYGPKNQKSILKGLPKFLIGTDYFNGEWSFAQFRVDDPKCICAFGPNNTIMVLSYIGKYYLASFDKVNGGECTLIKETKLTLNEN